ncbi:MAG: preprotein translocase subunit YajC [Oscillospiraceae bacterium]|nr:preprotein translocase subunit YajC [Oscillospiraceae bacterium]
MFGLGGDGGTPWMMFALIGGMMVLMVVMQSRSSKKRKQQEQDMRDNLQITDEIMTIGGVLGRVMMIEEDSLVIESCDNVRLRIARTSIHTNITQQKRAQAEQDAAKAEQEEARNARVEEINAKRKKSRKGCDE